MSKRHVISIMAAVIPFLLLGGGDYGTAAQGLRPFGELLKEGYQIEANWFDTGGRHLFLLQKEGKLVFCVFDSNVALAAYETYGCATFR